MRTTGEFGAKNHLTAPLEARFDRAEAHAAAEGLRAASKGQTLRGLTLEELINGGRR
jgi:hypothetical protein